MRARLEQLENQELILLPTNDGAQESFTKFAIASFTLNQQESVLMVLRPVPVKDKNKFFIPFADETSAIETYGSGRYLDLQFPPGSQYITIDFNLAYNPYCAYNSKFSCPLPPSENHLSVPVEAGEKTYEEI